MPVVIDKTIHRDTRFAAWEIEEEEQELESKLILDASERQFLQSIKPGKKRLQWLASRCLIRLMANTPAFIAMHTSDRGQPLITDSHKKVSISHSGNYAAVIMSESMDVGIDIEEVTPKILLIKHKFVGEEESKWMEGGDIDKYLIVWSAKEALYKWYARGDVDFRRHLFLQEFTAADNGLINATFKNEHISKDLQVHYEMYKGFVLAWVAG